MRRSLSFLIRLVLVAALALFFLLPLAGCTFTGPQVRHFSEVTKTLSEFMHDRQYSGYLDGKLSAAGVGEVSWCLASGGNTHCGVPTQGNEM